MDTNNTVNALSPTPKMPVIDWEELQKEQRKIKRFIKFLDVNIIGKSYVRYDKKNFTLALRSNWTPASWQTGANFEETQLAFIHLKQKVEFIATILNPLQLHKKEDCTHEMQTFWHKLITLQALVNDVAKFGLAQLCQNYNSYHETQKAASLEKFGQEAFASIKALFDNFTQKILAQIPDLKADFDLEKFKLAAQNYLRKRERLWKSMRDVKWTLEEGVCIPMQLIIDTQKDLKKTKILNKRAIRNAACFIKLPEQANSIAAQGGSVLWKPMRPVCEHGQVVFKKGITGTCERDLNHIPDLCNVYYKLDNQRVVITVGAIDSSQKALEMVHVMQHIHQNVKKNTRWRLHQLNSFYSESRLIKNVQNAVVEIEKHLSTLIPNTTFVHINTAFNAATRWDSNEDAKSFENINAKGLIFIANYAIETIESLLKETSLLDAIPSKTENPSDSPPSLISSDEEPSTIDFPTLKLQFIHVLSIIGSIPDLKAKVDQISAQLNTSTSPKFTNSTTSTSSSSSTTTTIENGKNTEDDDESIETSDSAPYDEEPSDNEETNAEQLKLKQESIYFQSLTEAQKKLQQELIKFDSYIFQFNEFLKTQVKNVDQNPSASKAILILEVFHHILTAQLNPSKQKISRCTEIELFLLLDRLLDISVIISCYSGLDRTGSVVAFEDSLAQIEKQLYQTHSQIYDAKIAQVKTFRDLFNLIINLDVNRINLFRIAKEVLSVNYACPLISNIEIIKLTDYNQKSNYNLRNSILEGIDQYTQPADVASATRLKYTLYYLELIATHLLSTQLEKTSYSCAVPGLKYHHDVNWVKKYFIANPHPIERLPQFIFTKGHAIQLVFYYEGWTGTTISLNPIAVSLISRLSQYRST